MRIDSRAGYVKTLVALASTAVLSAIAMVSQPGAALILLVATLSAAAAKLRWDLARQLKYLVTLISPYVLLSLGLQLCVDALDLEALCLYAMRISTVYVASALTLRYVSVPPLFRMLSRLGCEFALAVCMAIRLLSDGGELIKELGGIYRANVYGGGGLTGRVAVLRLMAFALGKSLLVRAMSMAEAAYVRYGAYLIREDSRG